MISLSGLLLVNKVLSASKLIGDILMPAFLTKNEDLQRQLTKELPVIACLALGSYNVVLDIADGILGHAIYDNGDIKVAIVCSKCHKTDKTSNDHVIKNLTLNSESNSATENQSTTLGLRNLIGKFLNANQYVDLNNTQYWVLVSRLCNHYYVFSGVVPTDLIKEDNCHHIIYAVRPFIGNTFVSK